MLLFYPRNSDSSESVISLIQRNKNEIKGGSTFVLRKISE
jgi:hypothetical protein